SHLPPYPLSQPQSPQSPQSLPSSPPPPTTTAEQLFLHLANTLEDQPKEGISLNNFLESHKLCLFNALHTFKSTLTSFQKAESAYLKLQKLQEQQLTPKSLKIS